MLQRLNVSNSLIKLSNLLNKEQDV